MTQITAHLQLLQKKLSIISSALGWKLVRELRNSINHEYEEDQARLQVFFISLQEQCPTLFTWHDQLENFCVKQYPAIDTSDAT